MWHHGVTPSEGLFYFWSAGRILSEAKEFGDEDETFMTNLNAYLADPWNALDALYAAGALSNTVHALSTPCVHSHHSIHRAHGVWCVPLLRLLHCCRYNLFVLAFGMMRVITGSMAEEHILPGEDHWVSVVGGNMFAIMLVLVRAAI